MKLMFCFLGLAAIVSAQDLKSINDAFTAKMFQAIAAENRGKNVVLSAFSVLPPLAQISLAAEGETHDELLQALGLPDDSTTKSLFAKVIRQLHNIRGVELQLANRIYVAADARIDQQFAATSIKLFESELENIDFAQSSAAVQEINAWVENHTNHTIKDLLHDRDVDGGTRAVLVNAIHFKGRWVKEFDKAATTPDDFHLANGRTIQVPMMSKSDYFNYGESKELDAKLLEMKYNGGETSFLVVLPNQANGIDQLQEALKNPALLESAVANMDQDVFVEVSLPKFKIETTTDLETALKKLNIKRLFTADAQLYKMLENEYNLFVSSAIQKAYIEVNEEGTEAAAANAFPPHGLSFSNDTALPYIFEANRPFYYELRLGENPLFNGEVWRPDV